MAKPKLAVDQYNDLKNFLSLFATRFMYTKVVPKGDLVSALEAMEKDSPRRAADALMMMINDCLEMSSDWRGEEVRAFDAELESKNIITLTTLRRQYSKQYARVLKRGKINSEGEYYLLKGMLDGGSADMVPNEIATLTQLLTDYEKLNAIRGRGRIESS